MQLVWPAKINWVRTVERANFGLFFWFQRAVLGGKYIRYSSMKEYIHYQQKWAGAVRPQQMMGGSVHDLNGISLQVVTLSVSVVERQKSWYYDVAKMRWEVMKFQNFQKIYQHVLDRSQRTKRKKSYTPRWVAGDKFRTPREATWIAFAWCTKGMVQHSTCNVYRIMHARRRFSPPFPNCTLCILNCQWRMIISMAQGPSFFVSWCPIPF